MYKQAQASFWTAEEVSSGAVGLHNIRGSGFSFLALLLACVLCGLQLILCIVRSLQQSRTPFVDSGKKAASVR